MEVRLYNNTDAAIVGGADATRIFRPTNAAERQSQGGFAEVVFAGVLKSFTLQFRTATAGTSGCADARIEIWRVS